MKTTKEMMPAALVSGKTRSRLNDYNRKLIALFLLTTVSLTVSAQKSAVLNAFSKHSINTGILNSDIFQQPAGFGFDFQQTTVAAGKEKTVIAQFNPSKPTEEQWTVVSIDGKSPSKGDIKSFRKDRSQVTPPAPADESSYKIEKETSDYLVISFKQDPASITKDVAFVRDCRSYMTINLKTKKAEQIEVINEKPVTIKMLNAEKFNIVTKYEWSEQANHYLMIDQHLNILSKFLGQSVAVETTTAYSNYARK